jgi:hypothetical protein
MTSAECIRAVGFLSILAALAACGGEADVETAGESDEPTTGGELAAEPNPEDEMQIEGILGTISELAIEDGIQRNLGRITRCFSNRYDEVDVLGGQMEMSFRVKTDGTVRWVYLRRSTVGDRDTERCILNILSRITFARPHGGEAEFSTPLSLDPPEDVRPPVEWPSSRVSSLVSSNGPALISSCAATGEGFHVTAYVGPGGEVLAAGAAVDHPDIVEPLDCVANGVLGWSMPDPGSYPAKVTFDL